MKKDQNNFSKAEENKGKDRRDSGNAESWCDKVREQIMAIRDEGLTNMFDADTVFHLAVAKDFYELADIISTDAPNYRLFILTGDPELLIGLFERVHS